MTYEEVRRYLALAEQAGGIRPGLLRMRQLMDLLGNPEKKFGQATGEPVKAGIIHVAGTNGKGSILAFLDEILRRAGYRVVRYTSPAVFTYLERYVVDGKPVSEEKFAALAERVIIAARKISEESGDPPTVFEMETAIAYLLAAEETCDIFLVETGMGGRLDATNIEEKVLVSVISSVSMDHMQFLGNTLEEIAREKAGIIRDGCPVVVSSANRGSRDGEPENIAETKAEDAAVRSASLRNVAAHSTPLRKVTVHSAARPIEEEAEKHNAPIFWGDESVPYRLGLAGAYQQENAGTAYAVIRILRKEGFHIPEACVREGFEKTVWPGRFEIVRHHPLCVLDGAHNADAAEKLARTLQSMPGPKKRGYFVLGMFRDKEYEKVVQRTVPLAEEVYVFAPDPPRGLPARVLADCAKKYTDRPVHICESVEEAVGMACEDAKKNDAQDTDDTMVLCYGSLSCLGRAKKVMI